MLNIIYNLVAVSVVDAAACFFLSLLLSSHLVMHKWMRLTRMPFGFPCNACKCSFYFLRCRLVCMCMNVCVYAGVNFGLRFFLLQLLFVFHSLGVWRWRRTWVFVAFCHITHKVSMSRYISRNRLFFHSNRLFSVVWPISYNITISLHFPIQFLIRDFDKVYVYIIWNSE